jgi:hypothetical protein
MPSTLGVKLSLWERGDVEHYGAEEANDRRLSSGAMACV